MKANNVIDIFAAIVTVALVTTIVTNKNSAGIVSAGGTAFATSIRAAMGH